MISWPVARATTREKLRTPSTAAIGACFVAAAALGGPGDAYGGFGGIFFVLLTLALGAGILSDELASGHAQLVLLRPITRAAWLGGRLAGAGIALSIVAAIGWIAAASAAAIGRQRFPLSALAVMPLGLLWGLAWLAVLTAIGVVLPAWTNAGAVVLAAVAWNAVRFSLPVVARHPEWATALARIAVYLGPQDPRALAAHWREGLGPALYDLCWLFFAWLVAALLFNRRELARRSG